MGGKVKGGRFKRRMLSTEDSARLDGIGDDNESAAPDKDGGVSLSHRTEGGRVKLRINKLELRIERSRRLEWKRGG